ncbi:MAG TPA: DUF308 domain-containing protein [Trueperaceae bacterium]|nr:DUF308 domain-containing protein [Trueperaceae bacterium]HRQ09526.1 DUF308 domain-containing protein [Trueperaceae bacterium]
MFRLFTTNWWAIVLRGVVGLLFGVAALVWPALTLTVLLALFAAFTLVDGAFALVAVLFGRAEGRWWVQLVEGLISIAAGLVTLAVPGLTAVAFVLVVAAWAVLSGIFRIVMAIRLRKEIDNEWLLALGGVLSLVLGIVFFARPGVGILSMVWVLGLYALLFGLTLIVLGFRLRGLKGRIERGVEALGGGADRGA